MMTRTKPRTGSRNSARPVAAAPKGNPRPRIFTPPARPLSRRTSRGWEVIDFADAIGATLLPWQEWVLKHALELNPDDTFRFRTILILVARQNGKSKLGQVLSLWRMYMDSPATLLGVAQDLSLARDQMNACIETVRDVPALRSELGKVRSVYGDEWFEAAGGRYSVKAMNRRAGRGRSIDLVIIDELREQITWDGWGAVSKTTMAKRGGQTWCFSNAGDEASVVLNRLHETGLAGTDPTMFLAEYSGTEDCALDDIRAIAQANPGLGHVINFAAIDSARILDPPAIYRTEVLCQHVTQIDGAISLAAWKDCADPAGTMDPYRKHITACFDISPDEQHSTLVVAARTPNGQIRIESAGAWDTTAQARDELPDLLARIRPQATGWYPGGPGAAFMPILEPLHGSTRLTGTDVTGACQGLADLVRARLIVHPDDPLLNAHIAGARKLASGDSWRFARKNGLGHVDAAYAVAGAVHLAATMPELKKAVFRVISY